MICLGTRISKQALILSELPVWKTERMTAREQRLPAFSSWRAFTVEEPGGAGFLSPVESLARHSVKGISSL